MTFSQQLTFSMSPYNHSTLQLELSLISLKSLLADAMQWIEYYNERVDEAGEESDPADVFGLESNQEFRNKLEDLIAEIEGKREILEQYRSR